jgi:hypothetical protein
MAESLNRRKSIFLSLDSHYECMRVAPLVTSAHHLGKHEAKLATLEIMVRAIRTRKIWPLASPRVLPKSLPNP